MGKIYYKLNGADCRYIQACLEEARVLLRTTNLDEKQKWEAFPIVLDHLLKTRNYQFFEKQGEKYEH